MWTQEGPDGPRVVSQGTALTIGLFLGLVGVKFALGTLAYFTGISDGGGFGEVLFMIAIMVALQAQIMWRRAQVLLPHVRPRRPARLTPTLTRRRSWPTRPRGRATPVSDRASSEGGPAVGSPCRPLGRQGMVAAAVVAARMAAVDLACPAVGTPTGSADQAR